MLTNPERIIRVMRPQRPIYAGLSGKTMPTHLGRSHRFPWGTPQANPVKEALCANASEAGRVSMTAAA